MGFSGGDNSVMVITLIEPKPSPENHKNDISKWGHSIFLGLIFG
jgi:hypothetical protein